MTSLLLVVCAVLGGKCVRTLFVMALFYYYCCGFGPYRDDDQSLMLNYRQAGVR